jgi:hypothetical protein
LTLLSFSCNAQVKLLQSKNYETKIIGLWTLESDTNYKLEFLTNGKCKEYNGNDLLTIYDFSIKSYSCENYSTSNSIYLKWIDNEDSGVTCFEIGNITDSTLSLMIIDRGKMLLFNKQ